MEAKYRLKYRCKIPLARRDKLYFMPDPADDKKSAKKKTSGESKLEYAYNQRRLLQRFCKTRNSIENIRATASSAISKKRKHLEAIAARVKKLGAAHRLMPGWAVTTAEGSSSSASSIDSRARLPLQ